MELPLPKWKPHWIALAWGFSEATFFVVVPDVILTRQALLERRISWASWAMAVTGALVGSCAIYLSMQLSGAWYGGVLEWLPGISENMIAGTRRVLEQDGFLGVLRGSFTGMPYKLYAHAAFLESTPLWLFLVWSIPARGIRFLLAMAVSSAVGNRLHALSEARISLVHLGIWLGFYVWYFSYFPR